MTRPRIVFDDVRVDFATAAGPMNVVDGVSLGIAQGEFVSIIGPSGCGKTTLMNLVGGFVKPTRGTVQLDGKPVEGPGPDRGVIFQEYGVFPWLTCATTSASPEAGRNRRPPAERSRSSSATCLMGSPTSPSTIRSTSPAACGSASRSPRLRRRAEFLLMDEPFGALDAQTRTAMQDLLLQVLATEGKTVLLITHSVDEAIYLSSRIVVVTARPAKVRTVIDVPFGYPRDEQVHEDPRFAPHRELV